MSGPTPRPHTPAAILAALGVTLALSACAGSRAASGAGAPPPSSPSAGASPSAPVSPVATTSVAIADFAFSPAVITVRAGTSVTWTNRDEDAHTVAVMGAAPSAPLQNGDTYAHTFAGPGRYSYVCSIHPYMRGMVVVTAG